MKNYLEYQYHNPYASIVKPEAYEDNISQTQESYVVPTPNAEPETVEEPEGE